jgi:inhibitor of KinA
MPDYRFLLAGDTAVVVELGNRIDLKLSAQVLSLARRVAELKIDGVIETVPTIRSLIIYYEPLRVSCTGLQEWIVEAIETLDRLEPAGRKWRLPVCYDPAVAPDLRYVARQTGLSRAQVVERHCGLTYHVYMLGFLPGLAYMGDVPTELALPRRASPRAKIPAGSLGIAGHMTCIYPMDTPCGWHLIGRSPIRLWEARRLTGALLAPGDHVTFEPVSLVEYERLLRVAEEGILQIVPGN